MMTRFGSIGCTLKITMLLGLVATLACMPPAGGGGGGNQNAPGNLNQNAPPANLNQNGTANSNQNAANQNTNGTPAASWQLVLQNLPAALLSVSGTSATNVYAVGADPGDGRGPLVLRHNGTDWRRVETGQTGDLWWITDQLIGENLYTAGEGGLVLRLDPGSGTFQRLPTPFTDTLFGIWGSSSNDIWVVGGAPSMEANGGVIWHFDGVNWTMTDLSAFAPVPWVFKVWGRRESEVYAVGFFGLLLRFDGTNWMRMPSGVQGDPSFLTVHGNADLVVAVGGMNSGVILEDLDSSFSNRAPALSLGFNGVFVPANGAAVAVGRELEVAFRTSNGWELQQTGLTSTRDFHATWMDPGGAIWAVGGDLNSQNRGLVVHYGTQNVSSVLVP